jgi:hypothetical protein
MIICLPVLVYCLAVHLSVCSVNFLAIHLSVYLGHCLAVHLSAYPNMIRCLSVCSVNCLAIHLSVFLGHCLAVHLSDYPKSCLAVLSVCLSWCTDLLFVCLSVLLTY